MTEKRIDVVVRTGKSKEKIEKLEGKVVDLAESLVKAKAKVASFESEQKKLGNTVDKSGVIFNKNGEVIKDLSVEYNRLRSQVRSASGDVEKTKRALGDLNPVAQGVRNGIAGIGRSAGQAGIQVQQFFGQIQGGQDLLVATSAQAADLGFVLGFPLAGAIAGISASIVGLLAPSLFEGEKRVKELTEKLKELKEEAQLSADQLKFLAINEEKENREKRLRIKDIGEEIKGIERQIEVGEDLLKSGRILTDGDIRRASAVFDLREELAALRAEQDLLDNQLRQSSVDDIFAGTDIPRTMEEAKVGGEAGTQVVFNAEDQEQAHREMLQMSHDFETAELEQKFAFLTMSEEQNAAFIAREDAMKEQQARRDMARAVMVARLEEQQQLMKLQTARNVFGSLDAINKAFFNDNKALNRGLIIADTAAAAISEYKKGGPWAAAAAVAFGAVQLKANESSSVGGGSFSGSVPSVTINDRTQQQQPQQFNQLRTVDIRLDDDAVLTGAAVKELISGVLASDEDVTLQITANQNQLQREGAI